MEIIRYGSKNLIEKLRNNEMDIHKFLELCDIINDDCHYWRQEDDRKIIPIKIIIPDLGGVG